MLFQPIMPSCFQQALGPRRVDERGQPPGFFSARPPAERCNAVEAGPSAPGRKSLRRPRLDHQTVGRHLPQRAVQHAGPELHPAARAVEDFLRDREPVQVVIGQGQQDLKPMWCHKREYISIDIYTKPRSSLLNARGGPTPARARSGARRLAILARAAGALSGLSFAPEALMTLRRLLLILAAIG